VLIEKPQSGQNYEFFVLFDHPLVLRFGGEHKFPSHLITLRGFDLHSLNPQVLGLNFSTALLGELFTKSSLIPHPNLSGAGASHNYLYISDFF
jgi:hypothetical protein